MNKKEQKKECKGYDNRKGKKGVQITLSEV